MSEKTVKVLISTSSFGLGSTAPLDKLDEEGVKWVRNPYGRTLTEDEAASLVEGLDGLIAGTEPITKRVLGKAKRLQVISRVGVGTDNIDLCEASRLGIQVTTTPDSPTQAVAELTLGGLLTLLRRIHRMDDCLHKGFWKRESGPLLFEKTVGIIGLGRIGKRIVELLKPFHTTILFCDVAPDYDWAYSNGLKQVQLAELLRRCDIVTIHVTKSSSSSFILGQNQIDLLREGSYLVNTARGGLIDEVALLNALNSGQIAGAYLDTFGREPYVGPLQGCEKVLLTPHAGSSAFEARNAMEMEAVQNVLRCLTREVP